MAKHVLTQDLSEAKQLLEEINAWSEDEIERLPKFYRERAKEFRSRYMQQGEE